MKGFIITLFIALLSIGLTACSEDNTKEETKSRQWYLENKDAMTSKVAQCQNNPGQLKNNPDCINAKAAFLLLDVGSL